MKYVFTALIIAQLFTACSSRYGIYKASAYVRERVAGTIRVDDNGRPLGNGVSQEHLLFIETDSQQSLPFFTGVWLKQKAYAVQPVEIKQPQQIIGKTSGGDNVVIRVNEGHKLWQLVLTPREGNVNLNQSLTEKIQQKNIVLTGNREGKDFVYAFDKEEKLQPVNFQ